MSTMRQPLKPYRFFIDFDNTMATTDVLDGIIRDFSINDGWKSLQADWERGVITTRACLEGQMNGVRVSVGQLREYLAQARLDPHCGKLFAFLKSQGIAPVI